MCVGFHINVFLDKIAKGTLNVAFVIMMNQFISFFKCHFARAVWCIVQGAPNLVPP